VAELGDNAVDGVGTDCGGVDMCPVAGAVFGCVAVSGAIATLDLGESLGERPGKGGGEEAGEGLGEAGGGEGRDDGEGEGIRDEEAGEI
jgi:hypothetical protein